MRQPIHFFAMAFGLAVVLGAPAIANDGNDEEAGYRVADRDGEFRLFEHGIWARQGQDGTKRSADPLPPMQQMATVTARPSGSSKATNYRRALYLPHVMAMEARFGLPGGLLDALVWTESRYNPLAVSKAGAGGLGQLMVGTARELGVANRFDPRANLEGSARYLRQMLDEFGVVHLALAAYNAGPGAVRRAGGIPKNGETPRYVRDVLRHWRL
ncbi:lytic transglycosylase domain-containing protein [Croceicoccus bisphenolivorans]|uniref:lytic transglycosylase domain-containing protein n=1 Tax=Croceicoccus bisphenolivorans TaxID=1783232 RepID=UPI000AC32877|nr:lytic transglycosylase domain-containing protein [Croceicoccus bisphenolivorans]